MKKIEKKLFPVELLTTPIDAWMKKHATKHRVAFDAWAKFRALVTITAIIDYGMRPKSDERARAEALALAWEDAFIAFRGYADNVLTGPLLQLWGSLPAPAAEQLRAVIEVASEEVKTFYTQEGLRWRYLAEYRQAPVLADSTAFNLPCALPINGKRTIDWAEDLGYDGGVLNSILHEMEAREQAAAVAEKRRSPARRAPAASARPASPESGESNVIQFRPRT